MTILKLVLFGRPITKKNSSRIIRVGRYPKVIPSEAYVRYESDCIRQITGSCRKNIEYPINLKVEYYMPTKHRVDLVNLLEATCDILVKAGVIADDNSNIVVSHDGSRVYYDKHMPRCEIYIDKVE